ncbi:hypothetical protein [Clostridium estertheticum]|uniref:hypothetical protein n=1 Tax=Clostridium estertheticum TaxID=238834 RepID=UPI001C6E0C0F|nr:hypothetical protein [Clostridium estertheticum]MBW9151376.1 hypothetical protein [Clostridium estertheticum]WLC84649.1 hypothetical protein KTC97_02320 [Clostridium estertheticum]
MNKKITSTALAALMIAGSTSFSAFAAMSNGTVVIGTKAYDIDYANDPANATEISAAINVGGTVYYKDFNGNWVDNITGASVNASVIPAVTYTNSKGTTQIGAGDASVTTATSATVTATGANTFKAVFNGAVKDISKVTFTTKRGTTPVTMVTKWNAAQTEATLTYVSNLPEDVYTIAITNDTVVYAPSTVTITKQKVSKIAIIGDTVAVAPTTTSAAGKMIPGQGYVSYQVLDQYGADITDSSLANSSNINWNSSIGTVTAKKGLLEITSYSDTVLLTQYTSTIVTAIDSDSSASSTSTLKVSLSQGTLSNVTLNSLTNVDNQVFKQGDTVNKFYLDFTAMDLSGNATKNMTLLKKGMLDSNPADSEVNLYSSNPSQVTATLVEDPSDSNKGVIEVKAVDGAASIFTDTPIVITAMTKTGKSSSITINLKKASTLDTLNISLPDEEIAEGDTDVTIPFTAFDQDGKVLTKYSDILGTDNISSHAGLVFTKNADQTLRISIDKISKGTTVYQVVTKTGKNSMITVKSQDVVASDALAVDTTVIKQYMQVGASQKLDLGVDAKGLSIKDQYGRAIDLSKGSDYSVVASVTGTDGVITTPQTIAKNGTQIMINGVKEGTQTVKFTVWATNPKTNAYEATDITKNVTFTVVKDSDIVSLVSNAVPTLYAKDVAHDNTAKGYVQDTPDVFGKLSTGTLVKLADSAIKSVVVSNSTAFSIYDGEIYANAITDATKTAAGSVTTSALVDGSILTATTALNSSSVVPAAASVGVTVDALKKTVATPTGVSISNDTITLTKDALAKLLDPANSLYRWNDGVEQAHGDVYFTGLNQYATKGEKLSYATVINPTTQTAQYAINGGKLSVTGVGTANDNFTVTVVAASGASKTVKFTVDGTAVVVAPATKLINEATASVVTAEKAKSPTTKAAAQLLVTALDTSTAKTDLQTRINNITVLSDSQLQAATVLEFNTNLAANGNTLLGGTINNTAKTITVTDPTATTGTGVFTTLDKLNVTSVTFASRLASDGVTVVPAAVITLTDKEAAKAKVLAYFNAAGLDKNTSVDLAVKGTNGTSVVKTYTILGIN